ncbi:hypothetical protein [uncultured Alsobacter sp.]|uniref:helix-turn-helix transcriptional regulator n=1 Tax=uncultured Alsobacter sp. TaxID=1748258 RepID=UPI0025E2A761|nr:hypothetical protein [uncultured Alsobacter sp.]
MDNVFNKQFFSIAETFGQPGKPGLIPVSRATGHAGIKSGVFPSPVKIGGRRFFTATQLREIVAKIERGELAQPLQPRRKHAA